MSRKYVSNEHFLKLDNYRSDANTSKRIGNSRTLAAFKPRRAVRYKARRDSNATFSHGVTSTKNDAIQDGRCHSAQLHS